MASKMAADGSLDWTAGNFDDACAGAVVDSAAEDDAPRVGTKAGTVANALRTAIVEGRLRPGERVKLRRLAQQFRCSEIPVREAIRLLEADKLLVIVPHGGARVAEVSFADILHFTEIRAMLEPQATCLAAPHVGAGDLARLETMLNEMSDLVLAGASAEYARANRRFHSTILSHCPNRHLAGLIENLWDKAEWGRIVHQVDPGHIGKSLGDHEEIVAAIRAGDHAWLLRATTRHSRFGLESVRRVLSAAR